MIYSVGAEKNSFEPDQNAKEIMHISKCVRINCYSLPPSKVIYTKNPNWGDSFHNSKGQIDIEPFRLCWKSLSFLIIYRMIKKIERISLGT